MMFRRPLWHYILFVSILGIVVLFVFSAPFNSRIRSLAKRTTSWTPKRIRDRPEEYLLWAIEKSNATRNELQDHKLSLLSRRHAVRQSEIEAKGRQSTASNLLVEARRIYLQSDAEDSWPALLNGKALDRLELQRRIVSLSRAEQRHERLVEEQHKLQPLIALRLDQIDGRITDIDDLQARLTATMELVNLSQNVEDCRRIHETVSNILQMNNAVSEMVSSPGIDLIVDDQIHEDKFAETFASIMSE